MSDGPAGRSSLVTFAKALGLRRNATLGFGLALLIAAGAFIFRVERLIGPTYDVRGSPLLFLLLAFVLFVNLGLLLTFVLLAISAIRQARAG